jgi:chemosensory pili system protein ChpA (sensor histidine kinase/response regulator)
MANNHDYIALDWVKGEIKQTLSQAQHALEAFVENNQDTPQMTFCLNHIHQVHGTLQMVEFYGAALLAEEMEKLCQVMIEDKVANMEEAQEVLMDSLLQLENYLEHIQKGQRDLPVVLLPVLNDLRALQGQPLLSDTSLFTPNLSAAEVIPNNSHNLRMNDEQVIANLRKLRQMFQFSLAGIIRNQDLSDNFTYLYKVLSRLEKFCQGTPIGKIWWVAVGFLDAIQGDSVGLSSATKQLLRDLDYQIKLMIDEHKTILSKPLPTDLLKNLLYYVAKTKTESKRVDLLKEQFKLHLALPSEQEINQEREKLHQPGQETMTSVVEVLSEELNIVKDQLDLYVRGDEKNNENLVELTPQLIQIANTMAVLGLGVARKIVLEQISRIEDIANSNAPATDQTLMDMAGALLYVESSLSTLKSNSKGGNNKEHDPEVDGFQVPAEHFQSAHNALIYESRNGLEQAKNSIVNFIASQWDHTEIEDVPELLDSIRGGLQIIPLPQAAKLLGACSTYIRESLLATKAIPDWQQLDRLADAITSIEYYMERLSEGAHDNDRILKVAEESVAKLGFPTQAADENSVPVLSQYHVSDVATESPDAIEKESDQGLIDEDILEIFLEEASEVMDEIQIAMAQLKSNADDQKALQNLRRAFHTLKGSGRLVGAKAIADIAWPVESLLNKHLDSPLTIELNVFDFLDAVIDKLPELTQDFAKLRPSSGYEHLINRANILAGIEAKPGNRKSSDNNISVIPESGVRSEVNYLENEIQTDSDQKETAISFVASEKESHEPINLDESLNTIDVEEKIQPEQTTILQAQSETSEEEEDDLIDDEILEIFIEEASEVLEAIEEHLPVYLDGYSDHDALKELRRAFHTLKGSGRMVNANVIGETAWAIENIFNRIIDGSIIMNNGVANLVSYVSQKIPLLIESFEKKVTPVFDVNRIEEQAQRLIAGELVKPITHEIRAESKSSEPETDNYKLVDIDESLLEIFKNEAQSHVTCVEEFVSKVNEDGPLAITDDLSRALHTLKGSANTANIQSIANIAIPVEKIVKDARARNIEIDTKIAAMLSEAMQFIRLGIKQLTASPQKDIEGTEQFLAELVNLQKDIFEELAETDEALENASQDPQIVNIFLTEGLDILLDAESILNEWLTHAVSNEQLLQLVGEVKTLHRGATVAGLANVAELCECLEECYNSIDLESASPDKVFITDIKRGHDALIDMMDQLAAGLTTKLDNKLLAELRSHTQSQDTDQSKSSDYKDELYDKLDELEKQLDDTLPSYAVSETDNISESLSLNDEASSDNIMDAELAEIFLEEASELVNAMPPALELLAQKPDNENILLQLQRDMHTLRGGARLAEITTIADLADVLELTFDALIETHESVPSLVLSLLEEASIALKTMLKAVEELQLSEAQPALIDNLSSALNTLRSHSLYDNDNALKKDEEIDLVESSVSDIHEELTSPPLVKLEDTYSHDSVSEFELDPELAEIFLEEALEIINSSGELLHNWKTDVYNLKLVGELQRELHTLKGGARMAEVSPIGDLSHELETLFEAIVEGKFEASNHVIELCLSCHDALANMVDAVKDNIVVPTANKLLTEIKALTTKPKKSAESSEEEPIIEIESVDLVTSAYEEDENHIVRHPDTEYEGDLLPLFIDESKDILSAVAEYLELWKESEDGSDGVVGLQREMHTLKGGARLADVDAIGDLAEAVNIRLEKLIEGELSDYQSLYPLVVSAYQEFTEMLESLIHSQAIKPAPELIAKINAAGHGDSSPESQTVDTDSEKDRQSTQSSTISGDINYDEVDLEVLELFVEEAQELIEALEEHISGWSKEPENEKYNLEIQRVLHTIKGGARLSNLPALADESHHLESTLLKAQDNKQLFEGKLKEEVLAKQDILLKHVDGIKSLVSTVPEPIAQPKAEKAQTDNVSAAIIQNNRDAQPIAKSSSGKAISKTSAQVKAAKKSAKSSAPQETIRVSAGLLDSLVNLAGETSISRGRLEQQISDFGYTLEEMSATIERLREQLRRMDMETEAQVLFRAEKEGITSTVYEDFDPLEMDRYSSIQQLSRALTESTSDLQDLRDTLSDRSRDAETLLLQQSRINSELQEGLMKTRMIPFSSVVPRLRRIVRQIGGELNKQVEFDALNAEGEMDRSVLERMVAPLEHMLRNALDHGIENPEQRKKSGKPVIGMINLSLHREGGNIVLKMQDDGAGINGEMILAKALKQGLVKKDEELSKHEIMQFIMHQGFSTAEKVTQISGRGVGMDVVASEIKQMGGTIEIDSEYGKGTEFTIRLPFTVSVNRALMVNTGEDFYAIPLNTIEGIVRVSPYELEEYYKPNAPMYEYAGREYDLQYLGQLLHSTHQPKLQGQPLPLPVILVRGSEKPMALQVDSLMGSREIVVKSLGPQFAEVNGASGATILGDGSVVVILDLPALIRDDIASAMDPKPLINLNEVAAKQTSLVMVVDDSVTVRKVTTRLLERNGYDVITAKDGVDAIALLQDQKPDVMLLDIEMPRMDGFEVATLVRHDERLKDVPIIMITSRTGKKHKERAMSIGVNEYLGKPFQEKDLLVNIERYID